MKLGIISDTHINNWKNFDSPSNDRISRRLKEQIDVFRRAVDIFVENDVDAIYHGGDWVHQVGIVQNEVVNVIFDLIGYIKDSGLVIYSVVGNHDTPVRVNPPKSCLITNLINGIMHEDAVPSLRGVAAVNYYDEVDYDKLAGYDLVILHKTPMGCKVGDYGFEEGVDWQRIAKQNKFVMFGHIHQTQQLGDNCWVIGAPYHMTFGDSGDRGVWIVDTEVGVKFFPIESPKFLTVDTPDQVKEDGNYYRVLNSESKIDNDRVVSVITPKKFDERIKALGFHEILQEWLKLNDKDSTYLEVVKDILTEKISLVKNFFKGRLMEVNISDFGSVESVNYAVENGFTLVTGVGETFDSNGVGKTTVVGESLCWCLFGETTKGLTGDDVIRDRPDIQKDCMVEVLIGDDQAAFKIRRTRSSGLEIYNVYEDKKKNLVKGLRQDDRQEYLEGLLGFDKAVFMAACYFSQEGVMMLTGLGDAEKTGMVTNLLGFETYDDLYAKVLTKMAQFKTSVEIMEREKVELDKNIAVLENSASNLAKRVSEAVKKVEALEMAIEEYNGKNSVLDTALSSLVSTSGTIEEFDDPTKITSLRESEEKYKTIVSASEADLTAVRVKIDERKRNVYAEDSEIRQRDRRIDILLDEIKALSSLNFGERCDKCGAVITQENAGIFIDGKKAEIAALNKEKEAHNTTLNHYKDSLVELEALVKEYTDNKIRAMKDMESASKEIRGLEELRRVSSELKAQSDLDAERIRGQIRSNEQMIAFCKKQIKEQEDAVDNIKAERVVLEAELKALKEKIRELDFQIDKTNKGLVVLDFWKTAFSPRGIRSLLLDRFCNEINKAVNGFLSTISGGRMSIVMKPTATLKSGEERNKIGMDILLNGLPRKYKSLSGGEKRRVDISLCFGLNAWVSARYNLPNGLLGVVILDEIFSFLDKAGEETAATLLYHEGMNKAIFVIDHALNLSSYAVRLWKVRKVGDISTLEVV